MFTNSKKPDPSAAQPRKQSTERQRFESQRDKKVEDKGKLVEETKSQDQTTSRKQSDEADTLGCQKTDNQAARSTKKVSQSILEVRQPHVLDLQENASQPNILEIDDERQMDCEGGQIGNARDMDPEQSQLRTSLHEYFPNQRDLIDEAFREYCAFRSDGSDSYDASGRGGKTMAANIGLSQQSSASLPIVTSYEILVEKLKQKLGDFQILSFFNTTQNFNQFDEQNKQLNPSEITWQKPSPSNRSHNSDPNLLKTDVQKPLSRQQSDRNFDMPSSEASVYPMIQDQPSQGIPTEFKHSSLELEPEKEFENAKWIVLTNPQPVHEDKDSQMEDGPDKKESKSTSKDGPGQQLERKMEYASALYNMPSSNNHANVTNSQISPQKRYAHSSCMVGNKMYIFGGLNPPTKKGNLQTFYSCQFMLDNHHPSYLYKWDKIRAENPRARDSHTCVNVSDCLIMFGGCGTGKDSSFGDINKFDFKKKLWTRLEALGDAPPPREAHIAQVLGNNKMMIYGGINQDEESFDDTWVLVGINQDLDRLQSEIHRYQSLEKENGNEDDEVKGIPVSEKPEFLRWVQCKQFGDIPAPRDSHTSCVVQDVIYIFGGQGSGDRDVFFNDIYQIKIIEMKPSGRGVGRIGPPPKFHAVWKKIQVKGDPDAPMPSPRTSHTCCSYKNRYLVVVGGETTQDQIEGQSQDVEMKKESAEGSKDENAKNKLSNSSLVKRSKTGIEPTVPDQQITTLPSAENESNLKSIQQVNAPQTPVSKSGITTPLFNDEKQESSDNDAKEAGKDKEAKDKGAKDGSNGGESKSASGSQPAEEEEETNNKEPLSDVWVFDTFLSRWFEIFPKLLIQGSSAGKKIKKQFEPRLAHSAVSLDQFIVIFGGFNSKLGTLISNDLYVLTLNGESNCILPKALEKKQLLMQQKKKPEKVVNRKSSIVEEPKEPPAMIVVKTEPALTPPVIPEKPQIQVKEAFMESIERIELSGQMINSLIAIRPGQGVNKQLNQLKDSLSQNQMSVTSKQSAAVTLLDVHVQTDGSKDTSPNGKGMQHTDQIERYFSAAYFEHPTAVPNFQRTRLCHIMSLSQQIESPIVAIGNFVDNSVQAFYDQIITHQKVQHGEPLMIDISFERWTDPKMSDSILNTNGINGGVNAIIKQEVDINLLKTQGEENKIDANATMKSEDIIKPSTQLDCGKDDSSSLTQVQNQVQTSANKNPEKESQQKSQDTSKVGGREKLCIKIKDNGPGISPYQMKEMLTSFGMASNTRNVLSHTGPFSISEHGIGMKLSALRLGDTCFIITKTNPKNQIGIQYLTVGLISVKFHYDTGEQHLVVPLICYQIKNNESFLPLTPESSNVFSLIKKYTRPLFQSESDLQKYALNCMGRHGTHVLITDLKKMQSVGAEEIKFADGDIVRVHQNAGPNQVILSQSHLFENSLVSLVQVMFLKHPSFLRLFINGQSVHHLENPYNALRPVSQNRQNMMQTKQSEFAAQILTPCFQRQLKENQHDDLLLKRGLTSANELLQGVLVYRGNRFVRRLQGNTTELTDQARLLNDIIKSDEEEVIIGQKRTFKTKNAESQRDFLLSYLFKMNGIASVYQHASRTSLDKTNFEDNTVLQRLREHIENFAETYNTEEDSEKLHSQEAGTPKPESERQNDSQ